MENLLDAYSYDGWLLHNIPNAPNAPKGRTFPELIPAAPHPSPKPADGTHPISNAAISHHPSPLKTLMLHSGSHPL